MGRGDHPHVHLESFVSSNPLELVFLKDAQKLHLHFRREIADLVKKTESDMLKFRNFGRKSLKEISDILSSMGLHFGMDVDFYMDDSKAEAAARLKAQYS